MTDKPIDAYACAHNLRRWAAALKIPSGDFVNEDLRLAADMLDNYAEQTQAVASGHRGCKMKVFGRRLQDRGEQIAIDFDDIVFEVADGIEIRVSVYRARKENRVEIQVNEGVLVLLPRAANTAEAEVRGYRPVCRTAEIAGERQ